MAFSSIWVAKRHLSTLRFRVNEGMLEACGWGLGVIAPGFKPSFPDHFPPFAACPRFLFEIG
jgi:hypothetical protein